MKRAFCILIAALMLISLAACSDNGSDDKPDASSSAASSAATENSQKATETGSVGTSSAAAQKATEAGASGTSSSAAQKTDGVDVDLTVMNSTMVYSEVQNMMQHPDDYMGKIVKMKGPFNVTETEDNRYYACIIKDAAACCSTGIEFVWTGDHTYPDDYPEVDQEVTVTGAFNVYTEGTGKYLQLKDSQVEF